MLAQYACELYVFLHIATTCPLTDLENGEVTTNGLTYLSLAMYTCNTGYVLTPSNGSVRVCEADGEWTGEIPTCLRELEMVNGKKIVYSLHSC